VRRLSFKKAYIEPILAGRKTSTLRAATHVQEGDEVNLACEWGKPPFAVVIATAVTDVGLADVDEDLARAEGFDSREELVAALAEHYPELDRFVRIDFEILRAGSAARSAGRSAAQPART